MTYIVKTTRPFLVRMSEHLEFPAKLKEIANIIRTKLPQSENILGCANTRIMLIILQ